MVPSSSEHIDRPSNNPTESPEIPEESSGGKSSTLVLQNLAAWPISRNLSRRVEFLNSLPLSFAHLGEKAPPRLTNQHGEDGLAGVMQEKWILFQQL